MEITESQQLGFILTGSLVKKIEVVTECGRKSVILNVIKQEGMMVLRSQVKFAVGVDDLEITLPKVVWQRA